MSPLSGRVMASSRAARFSPPSVICTRAGRAGQEGAAGWGGGRRMEHSRGGGARQFELQSCGHGLLPASARRAHHRGAAPAYLGGVGAGALAAAQRAQAALHRGTGAAAASASATRTEACSCSCAPVQPPAGAAPAAPAAARPSTRLAFQHSAPTSTHQHLLRVLQQEALLPRVHDDDAAHEDGLQAQRLRHLRIHHFVAAGDRM